MYGIYYFFVFFNDFFIINLTSKLKIQLYKIC